MKRLLLILIVIAVIGLALTAPPRKKNRNKKGKPKRPRGKPKGPKGKAKAKGKPKPIPTLPGDDSDDAEFYCPALMMACDVMINSTSEVIFSQPCPDSDCMDGPSGIVPFNDVTYAVHWCMPPVTETPEPMQTPNLTGLAGLGCPFFPNDAAGPTIFMSDPRRFGGPPAPPTFQAFWEDACYNNSDCMDDEEEELPCLPRIYDFMEEEGGEGRILSFCEDYMFYRRTLPWKPGQDEEEKFFCPFFRKSCDLRLKGAEDSDVIYSHDCPVGDCVDGPQGEVLFQNNTYELQWCSPPPDDFDWIQYKINQMDEEKPDFGGLMELCPRTQKWNTDESDDLLSSSKLRYCRVRVDTVDGEVKVEEYPDRDCRDGSTCSETVYDVPKGEFTLKVNFCMPDEPRESIPFWELTCDPEDETACDSESESSEPGECLERITEFEVDSDAEPTTLSFCEDFKLSKEHHRHSEEDLDFFCPATFMACRVIKEGDTDPLLAVGCPEGASCMYGPTGSIEVEDTIYNIEWCPPPSANFQWFYYLEEKLEDIYYGLEYSELRQICDMELLQPWRQQSAKAEMGPGIPRIPVTQAPEFWVFMYCRVRTADGNILINFPDRPRCPGGTVCPDTTYDVSYDFINMSIRVCPPDLTPFWDRTCSSNDDCPNKDGDEENECTEKVKEFKEDPDAEDDTAVSLSFCDDFTFFPLSTKASTNPGKPGKPKKPKKKQKKKQNKRKKQKKKKIKKRKEI